MVVVPDLQTPLILFCEYDAFLHYTGCGQCHNV